MVAYEVPRDATEEELAQQVRAGNERAMRLLFHRLASPLYQFLRKRGARDSEAEDVVAETLEIMFDKIAQFDGKGKFFSWVCSIAWHCFLRKRSGFTPEFLPLEECLTVPCEALLEPEEMTRRREQVALCQSYLEQLTPEQRHAVTLVELEGMSLKEAAAVLDSTVAAVAMLLARAKRRMQSLAARPALLKREPEK
jgi:RNA polymerase sigma factor (sigma-70 family)